MSNIKILHDDFWKGATLTESSEHENFTAENTQHRDFNKAWRSENGAGSGWGRFDIGSTNNKIDFEETAASELTATLTQATYNADTLATEIKTRLEAAGAAGYTVTYSDTTNKFTIVSDAAGGATLDLLWNTGTNAANSVGTTIGFLVAADDSGSLTYTSDNMRIHSVELLVTDFGSVKDIDAVCIRGHNIESGATIKAQFSDDNWASVDSEQALTVQDDILVYEWDSPKQYQYFRIYIEDVDNADGYVSLGTIYVGGQLQPTRNFLSNVDETPEDPSYNLTAEGGQEGSSIQFDHFQTWSLAFGVKGSTQVGYFDDWFAAVGTSKEFFIIEDPATPLTNTFYVKISGWSKTAINYATDYWQYSVSLREAR